MYDEEDPLILVKRGPFDWQEARYRLSKISRIHIDRETGGVQETTPYPMLFGYVSCAEAASGAVAHSCRHGEGPHYIKVCIPKSRNKHAQKLLAGLRTNLPEARPISAAR
jgi:hypothetical protein